MKCLAFDAIAAWRLFSLAQHAGDAAGDVVERDERGIIGALVERGKPLGSNIHRWMLLLARVVGWRPESGNLFLAMRCPCVPTGVGGRWCSGCERCVVHDRVCAWVQHTDPLGVSEQVCMRVGAGIERRGAGP